MTVTPEPWNVSEGIPVGTALILQNTGEGFIFLLQAEAADGASAKDDARVLEGSPAFRRGDSESRKRSALGSDRTFLVPRGNLVTLRAEPPPELRQADGDSPCLPVAPCRRA